MFSKAIIFNLALSALLLQRQITDTTTDTSQENKVLNSVWDIALRGTLADLDMDSTSTTVALELQQEITDPAILWKWAYKYPSNCAFLRRIQSCVHIDRRSTRISLKVQMLGTQKCIFTNHALAVAEIIAADVPLTSLSAPAGQAIAYKLATLASPLIVGKGANKLLSDLTSKYIVAKADAEEQERRENFNFEDDVSQSEWVEARLS